MTTEEIIWIVLGICSMGFGLGILWDGFFTHPEDN